MINLNGTGLLRCGKSCRLRWVNYLRPDLKRGNFGEDEEDLIIKLHALLGNRYCNIYPFYMHSIIYIYSSFSKNSRGKRKREYFDEMKI